MDVRIKASLEFSVSGTALEDALAEYDVLTVVDLLKEVLDKAVACDPGYANGYNNRGLAKLRTGDRNGAIEDFRRAILIRPDHPQAITQLRQLGVEP